MRRIWFARQAMAILLGGVMLMGVTLPLASADELSDRIRQIQVDIDRTQKELEAGEKKLEQLKSREQAGIAEISLIEKNIASISNNLAAIRSEERSLTTRINSAQASTDSAQAGLDRYADQYAGRIRAIYKRQRLSPIASLANLGSMTAMLRGFTMLRTVAESDLAVMDELRSKTVELKESTEELRLALEAKRKLAAAKQTEQVTLENSRKKQQAVIAEVKEDEAELEALNAQTRQSLEESQAEVDRYLLERDRANIPVAASLRDYDFTAYKGKLPWPVAGTVVSNFGRQVDPRTKTVTTNRGIEIKTAESEPVLSVGRGEVVMTQYMRGYGNLVIIKHPPDYYSIYGHLSDILVSPGVIVADGDVIGIAGNTGMIDESAPRLVLEILKVDTPENPTSWLTKDTRQVRK